jgi:hypothetical protein
VDAKLTASRGAWKQLQAAAQLIAQYLDHLVPAKNTRTESSTKLQMKRNLAVRRSPLVQTSNEHSKKLVHWSLCSLCKMQQSMIKVLTPRLQRLGIQDGDCQLRNSQRDKQREKQENSKAKYNWASLRQDRTQACSWLWNRPLQVFYLTSSAREKNLHRL